MLKRLRKKLSKLSVRSRSTSEKKDKDADDDADDALETSERAPNLTTPVVASDAPTAPPSTRAALRPATPSSSVTSSLSPWIPPPSPYFETLHPATPPRPAAGPTPPQALLTAGRGTPSPTPPAPPPKDIREYPWREQRFSSRAVPASIVHSYKSGPPTPRSKKKLTSLPPELLLAIFSYLQGDPTRPANVDYRGASDEPDRWYSHDWSLMQASKTCRYLYDIACTLLYSRAALLHEDDFAKIARLPERMRARIRHLTVSITALEQLYVYLSVLSTSSPPPSAISAPAFPHIILFSPHAPPFPSLAPTPPRKPYLRGTPFAPCFAPTQLISLVLFRPRGTRIRSGDAIGPGFAEFVVNGVLGYWRALERLHVRDPRGVWPGAPGMDLEMTSMRTLEWDTVLPPPRFEPGLRVLSLGEKHVPSALPAGLRSLRTKASGPSPAWPLPTALENLHVLRPHGLCAPCVRALALPRLAALRELRIALVSLVALEALVVPAGLRVLQLHLPALPALPALARLLEPLNQLRVLSLVLPSSVARSPSPTKAICETDGAHAAHLPLARAFLHDMCALREVHIACAESESCVWGRPSWISGRQSREAEAEGDAVWLGVGERALLD